jgi:GNAT superfamily N-acetyltransferase
MQVIHSPEVAHFVSRNLLRPQTAIRTLLSAEGLPLLTGLGLLLLSLIVDKSFYGVALFYLILIFMLYRMRGKIVAIGIKNRKLEAGIRLRQQRRRLLVLGIYVSPECRGQGLSKILLYEAMRYAEQNKIDSLEIIAAAHPATNHLIEHYLEGKKISRPSPTTSGPSWPEPGPAWNRAKQKLSGQSGDPDC